MVRRAFPERYQRFSGMDTRIPLLSLEQGEYYYEYARKGRESRSIPPCYHATVYVHGRKHHLGLQCMTYQSLIEGCRRFSASVNILKRTDRYLELFRAYECISTKRPIGLSAIRHSFAHATVALTKPQTVDALRQMFGGKAINLRRYDHNKEFYRQFGSLFLLTERELFVQLMEAERVRSKVFRGFRLKSGKSVTLYYCY
jgi:hypothetical protein